MSNILINDFGNKYCKASVPVLKPGMIVKVHQKIKEGAKERVQIFQGTVISVGSGNGISESFTVRKISEGIGVEKCYPIHSPNIIKIEVDRAQKVRRSKLNFLRGLSGKALRLKEVALNLREKTFANSNEGNLKNEEAKMEDKKDNKIEKTEKNKVEEKDEKKSE